MKQGIYLHTEHFSNVFFYILNEIRELSKELVAMFWHIPGDANEEVVASVESGATSEKLFNY